MFATLLEGDSKGLIERVVRRFESVNEQPPSNSLSRWTVGQDESHGQVLSERRLEQLVTEFVEDDEALLADMEKSVDRPRRIQMAPHSLTRLLLDKLRPGRYVTDDLHESDAIVVSQQTIELYDNPFFSRKYCQTWENAADESVLDPFLKILQETLPCARILDVGCGPGQYAIRFAGRGHEVVLLDTSSFFLNVSKERIRREGLRTPELLKCDILSPESRGRVSIGKKYDAIWCSGLFAHVPRSSQASTLQWFRGMLRPDGLLFVNILLDNPRVFARDGRYYSYHGQGHDFEARLENAGYDIIQMLRRTVHRNTYREPFLTLKWENYYCRVKGRCDAEHGTTHHSAATDLTAYAYDRSVAELQAIFVGARGKERTEFIHGTLDKICEYSGIDSPVVLDAGCGFGDFVLEMGRRGWKARGVDISHRMIEAASSQVAEGVVGSAEFEIADFRALPSRFADSFDAVICITAFQHVPHFSGSGSMTDVLRGFRHVLKEGGILRIDVRLGGEAGFDPDLRYVEAFRDEKEVIRLASQLGFTLTENEGSRTREFLVNAFRRPIDLRYAVLWLRKEGKAD